MANVVFTTTGIKTTDQGAALRNGTANASIAAGDAVYEVSENVFAPAQATAQNNARVVGIAMNGASSGQAVTVLTRGILTCDGVAKGQAYTVSATAGKLCPFADLVSTNWISYVGIALSATSLSIDPKPLGVQV